MSPSFRKKRKPEDAAEPVEATVNGNGAAPAAEAVEPTSFDQEQRVAAAWAPAEPRPVGFFDLVERPEVVVGAAFVGGLLLARVVRSIGR